MSAALRQFLYFFIKGKSPYVDNTTERASSSITPQVLVTTNL